MFLLCVSFQFASFNHGRIVNRHVILLLSLTRQKEAEKPSPNIVLSAHIIYTNRLLIKCTAID